MPYQNKKLTHQEQKTLLLQRIERGYPHHAPPHPIRFSGYYFITAANYNHQRILTSNERRTSFEHQLIATFQPIATDIVAWCVLTNHYHILIGIENFQDISSAIKKLHGRTSHDWNQEDGCVGQRKIWYSYSDRMIRNQEHYYRTVNYIHYNPVKHKYVQKSLDWPWSSLSLYMEDKGPSWITQQWKKFPPDNMGEGWDDFDE